MPCKYRHILTGELFHIIDRSHNRVIVKNLANGCRMYLDIGDFNAQLREVVASKAVTS